jgi:calmodulin
MADQ